MQAQTLPVLYTKSRQAMEVSTHTPFIAEIQTLLQNSEATDLKSAVEQLLRASGLLKGPIKDALKKRISEIPEVRSVLERLTALGLIIEDTGGQHVALTRLGESKTPIRLELKASAGNNIDMGSGVIGISGEAELALVATAQAPAVAATLGLPITASDVLHSCTLGGNVGIKGNIKAPMVNAEADAKASLGVTWHFQRSAEDTVLNSLVYSALDVGQGACPWDLEQVMRVLDEPRLGNGHLDALKAIDLRTERTVGFSAGIEVKRGFNREFEVAGAEGEQKIAATAAIGVNFGYSIRSRGLYDLRLIKQDGDVILRLDKSSETTSKRTFDLGAEVGISGVDALATGWINKLLPPPPVAMEEAIAKWSTPGTLLKAKLEAALKDKFSDSLAALIPILLGDATAENVAQQQVERLFQTWEEALNTRIAVISSSAQSVVDQLMVVASESLGEHYALVESALNSLTHDLVDRVIELQRDLKDEIDGVVQRIKLLTGQALTSTLKPLEQVGERVNELVKTMDTTLAPLASAVERLLARYDSLRKALLQGAQQAIKLKLAIAFSDTLEKTRGEGRSLSVRFRRPSKGAKRWFKDLVLGRVDIDINAIQQAAAASDDAFAVESGGFSAFASRTRSTSLTLDVFGMPFGDVRMLSSEVKVEVDLSGRIRVLGLRAKLSDLSNTLKESRAAHFTADFDVLPQTLGALPGTFSLGFELSDNRLKPKELTDFFAGFTAAGIFEPDRAERARQLLGNKEAKDVQLSVAIGGIGNALQNAAKESNAVLKREAWENCVRFMRPRADIARLFKKYPEIFYEAVVAANTPALAQQLAQQVLQRNDMSVTLLAKPLAREMRILNRAINAIPAVIEALGKIGKLTETLRNEIISDQRAREARDLLDIYLNDANRAFAPLVDVNDGVFGLFSERLPDITVALLAMLARLAGHEGLTAKPIVRFFTLKAKGLRQFGPPILID